MCKGAQQLRDRTYQAAGAEHPTQLTDLGVEGNAPDMLLRMLSQVAPLGFIESNGQTMACLKGLQARVSNLVFF